MKTNISNNLIAQLIIVGIFSQNSLRRETFGDGNLLRDGVEVEPCSVDVVAFDRRISFARLKENGPLKFDNRSRFAQDVAQFSLKNHSLQTK
jgi:hypothetical protein